MKTWIKTNSPVAHAVDIEKCNFRTVCGVSLVGDINKIKVPDENQPKCKKCLNYYKEVSK
jgi:hypothetical protein